MDQSTIRKPALDYQYEFSTDELDAMSACLDAHGFAVIKDVLSDEVVEGLKQAMGMSSISKSQVSRLCKDIDGRVTRFL